MSDCWGCKCKPGWGYNQSLGLLMPIQGEPPNLTSTEKNNWDYDVCDLSSTDINDWVSFLFFH